MTESEVTLGTWGPQDGPAGAYGVLSRVIVAYFKQLNASGGIAGRTVTLLNEDDSYQPARTATAVAKLVEQDRVFALIGGLGNQHNLQVLDYLVQRQVPYIAPATGLGLLSHPTRPAIFCVQPSYTVESTLLTRYALDALGATILAVFFQDNAAGREGRGALQAELRRRGLGTATDLPYAATDRNYSAQALRLQAGNIDTVIMYAIPQAGGAIIQELAKIGANPRLLASSLIDDPALFELVGPGIDGLILGAWLTDYNDKTNPQGSEFRAWLQANLPNERPGAFAATGYAYATIMAELLRRTGRDLTRDRFLETANALQNYTGSLVPRLSYTPDDHRGVKALSFQQARFADKTFTKLTDLIELP